MSENKKKYIDNFEIVEFNMDSLKKYCYTSNKKYEKYKYLIMLDLNKEELSSVVLGDEFMEEYKKELEELNEDETFTSAISYEDDQKYILNTEKWISFEEGVEKGIQEGIQQGVNSTIKNMYKQTISLEQISKIVNIPIDKIKEILNIKD